MLKRIFVISLLFISLRVEKVIAEKQGIGQKIPIVSQCLYCLDLDHIYLRSIEIMDHDLSHMPIMIELMKIEEIDIDEEHDDQKCKNIAEQIIYLYGGKEKTKNSIIQSVTMEAENMETAILTAVMHLIYTDDEIITEIYNLLFE
ncbi:hypothetical protein GUI12_00660 [Anaplasmataceae bacterium AB001_6]|nr:hypothetical protein GUI12_00660 [Anaplasmataceae bacterium AB001_6]